MRKVFFKEVGGIVLAGVILLGLGMGYQPASAQRLSASDAWKLVYQQLPDFPRENEYISRETGRKAENNTLISRMIWYHVYLKGRAPNYRFDWKLTLADYLSVNETMYDTTYPGHDTLRKNPFDGDKAAIARLTRRQRESLVQALVNVFTGNYQGTPTSTTPSQPEESNTTPAVKPQGGAELLK